MLPELELGQKVFVPTRSGKEEVAIVTQVNKMLEEGKVIISYHVTKPGITWNELQDARPLPTNELRSYYFINQ